MKLFKISDFIFLWKFIPWTLVPPFRIGPMLWPIINFFHFAKQAEHRVISLFGNARLFLHGFAHGQLYNIFVPQVLQNKHLVLLLAVRSFVDLEGQLLLVGKPGRVENDREAPLAQYLKKEVVLEQALDLSLAQPIFDQVHELLFGGSLPLLLPLFSALKVIFFKNLVLHLFESPGHFLEVCFLFCELDLAFDHEVAVIIFLLALLLSRAIPALICFNCFKGSHFFLESPQFILLAPPPELPQESFEILVIFFVNVFLLSPFQVFIVIDYFLGFELTVETLDLF